MSPSEKDEIGRSKRPSTIASVDIRSVVTLPSSKSALNDSEGEAQGEETLWIVRLGIKQGADPVFYQDLFAKNENDAKQIALGNPVGRHLPNSVVNFDVLKTKSLDPDLRSLSEDRDSFDGECYRILRAAGVLNSNFEMSEDVAASANDARRADFQNTFGENWETALQLEYVFNNYEIYSEVHYSALFLLHYHISHDDYSVGYLWRELKTILSKTEEKAISELARTKKAGQRGGDKSRSNKEKRIGVLLDAMEKLLSENPAIGRFGIRRLAQLAVEHAAKADQGLWPQGQGSVSVYLEDMKADHRFNERYREIASRCA